MGLVFISGDHPRHSYVAKQLYRFGLLSGRVIERRESFVPNPPVNLDASLAVLFRHHFAERERVEKLFFGDANVIGIPSIQVTQQDLNTEPVARFIREIDPQLVVSYGCHWLDVALLASEGIRFWNVHGGLSPDYRGAITHFWPSYFLEPQMTGMTVHETTPHLDAGPVLFQTGAKLVKGDTLHMLAARCVKDFADVFAEKLTMLDLKDLPSGLHQKSAGRLFRSTDWRPEHLRVIYEKFEDQLADYVLVGQIKGREPNLISVL